MSRGFIGGGNAGGHGRRDLTKKQSLLNALNFTRKRKQTPGEMVRQRSSHQVKSYKEMVEDLLDEKMTSMGRPQQFSLPGTVPAEQKEMSKGRKQAIEHFKMKQMKKRLSQREQKVDIVPRSYNGHFGGWIDKRGRIKNRDGMIMMTVDINTGVIRNRMGFKVGKYRPNSMTTDFKIQRLIDRYSKQHHHEFNPFGGPPDGRFNPFGPKNNEPFNPFGPKG